MKQVKANRDILKETKKFQILKNIKKTKELNPKTSEHLDNDDMIGKLISENPQLIDGDIIPADRSN